MADQLSVKRLGQTLGIFFAVLYLLCVAWDAVFPTWAMRSVWSGLLPGWGWLSAADFFLGLAEAYLWGWITAVIFVPIWRLTGRPKAAPGAQTRATAAQGGAAHVH